MTYKTMKYLFMMAKVMVLVSAIAPMSSDASWEQLEEFFKEKNILPGITYLQNSSVTYQPADKNEPFETKGKTVQGDPIYFEQTYKEKSSSFFRLTRAIRKNDMWQLLYVSLPTEASGSECPHQTGSLYVENPFSQRVPCLSCLEEWGTAVLPCYLLVRTTPVNQAPDLEEKIHALFSYSDRFLMVYANYQVAKDLGSVYQRYCQESQDMGIWLLKALYIFGESVKKERLTSEEKTFFDQYKAGFFDHLCGQMKSISLASHDFPKICDQISSCPPLFPYFFDRSQTFPFGLSLYGKLVSEKHHQIERVRKGLVGTLSGGKKTVLHLSKSSMDGLYQLIIASARKDEDGRNVIKDSKVFQGALFLLSHNMQHTDVSLTDPKIEIVWGVIRRTFQDNQLDTVFLSEARDSLDRIMRPAVSHKPQDPPFGEFTVRKLVALMLASNMPPIVRDYKGYLETVANESFFQDLKNGFVSAAKHLESSGLTDVRAIEFFGKLMSVYFLGVYDIAQVHNQKVNLHYGPVGSDSE